MQRQLSEALIGEIRPEYKESKAKYRVGADWDCGQQQEWLGRVFSSSTCLRKREKVSVAELRGVR